MGPSSKRDREDRVAGTALALAIAPAAARDETALRGRVLGSISREGRFGRFADRIARLFDWTIDDALRELRLLERPEAWGPGLMPGMALIPVRCGPGLHGALGSLARSEPGLFFPRHAHPGGEVTLVLDGALRDASGVIVARGDELTLGEGAAHDFVILDGAPCIAAAVAYRGIELL